MNHDDTQSCDPELVLVQIRERLNRARAAVKLPPTSQTTMSAWRSRSRRGEHDFPAPHRHLDDQERGDEGGQPVWLQSVADDWIDLHVNRARSWRDRRVRNSQD